MAYERELVESQNGLDVLGQSAKESLGKTEDLSSNLESKSP